MTVDGTAALALPTLTVPDGDVDLIAGLLANLAYFETSNQEKEAYYEGTQRVRQLGIAIPPSLMNLETVVGWPGTVTDVLEERLDWLGWTSATATDYGLADIYAANQLDVDSAQGHLDALIYGTAFAAVGAGDASEPSPLVTVESPRSMTGIRDARRRRLSAALGVDATDGGQVTEVTLYLPDRTTRYERGTLGGQWRVVDTYPHRLGRVPVVQLTNRPRASRLEGRSEISAAVRSYTDQAVRTLLAMEVNREFYASPQRWIMGADDSAFQRADGSTVTGWEAILGRWLAVGKDDDGDRPEVGQFPATSPQPYIDQIRILAQQLAAESGIPASYLGYATDNPASADAIREAQARLVKRAERRQTMFGKPWLEVGRLALLLRDGAVPDDYDGQVATKWRDAATPTRSAAADEAVKLTAAGILPVDSPVTRDRIGLSPQEQRQIEGDRRRTAGRENLAALADAAATARTRPEVEQLGSRGNRS